MSNNVNEKTQYEAREQGTSVSEVLTKFQPVYGVPGDTKNIKNLDETLRPIGILITIVLFIVGLIAMFSKKLSKKAKIIICLSMAFLIILIRSQLSLISSRLSYRQEYGARRKLITLLQGQQIGCLSYQIRIWCMVLQSLEYMEVQ